MSDTALEESGGVLFRSCHFGFKQFSSWTFLKEILNSLKSLC